MSDARNGGFQLVADLPRVRVPFVAQPTPHTNIGWLAPLRRTDGSEARDSTRVRVTRDVRALFVRFECVDRHVWSTHTERDAPLWEEEVVEVFLAAGPGDPADYFELEVNPSGALFDARVHNPHSRRVDMRVDPRWHCDGIEWSATRSPGEDGWQAELRLPLAAFCVAPFPTVWRANFYRIERPRGEPAEFTCWSPTHTDPPDFHKPRSFGFLELDSLD